MRLPSRFNSVLPSPQPLFPGEREVEGESPINWRALLESASVVGVREIT